MLFCFNIILKVLYIRVIKADLIFKGKRDSDSIISLPWYSLLIRGYGRLFGFLFIFFLKISFTSPREMASHGSAFQPQDDLISSVIMWFKFTRVFS